MKRQRPWKLAGFLLGAVLTATSYVIPAAGQIGLVVDNAGFVHAFDADTDEVLGSVALPGFVPPAGDCSIAADGLTGYVSTAQNVAQIVDLSIPSSPAIRGGVTISNIGLDSSLSPDGNFVLFCGGTTLEPISVVDTSTAMEKMPSFSLDGGASSCTSVEVCSNGSVLVTSSTTGEVRRLSLDMERLSLFFTHRVLASLASSLGSDPYK